MDAKIAQNENRILNSDTQTSCWVSYRYTIDYKSMLVKFQEEYFISATEDSRIAERESLGL